MILSMFFLIMYVLNFEWSVEVSAIAQIVKGLSKVDNILPDSVDIKIF